MDWKPTYKVQSDVKPSDKEPYLCKVKGSVVNSVPLTYSKEVALGKQKREIVFSSKESPQNQQSARVNPKTGRTLDRGIQLYRMWFNFLKLALELEELGVSLVTKQPTIIKNTNNQYERIPRDILDKAEKTVGGSYSGGMGARDAIFRCRRVQKVKVKRNAYKGWDLDRVLIEDFNTWWFGHEGWGYRWKKVGKKRVREYIPNPDLGDEKRRGHSHLFEGYAPSVIKSKDDWIDDPNFVYLRIDKTSQWVDVSDFMSKELGKLIKEEGRPRFKLSGKNPRVNVLQNNFNALVLSIKGVSPKDICTSRSVYLRKTDENFDSKRTKGESLTVPVSRGHFQYSAVVSKQRVMGLHHIFEVCEGRFGVAPPTGSK